MQDERRGKKACVLKYVVEMKKERELSDLRNGTVNTPPFFMIDALTPMKQCGLSFTELEDILKDLREELFIEKYVSRDSEWMGTDFQIFPSERFDSWYTKFLKETASIHLGQPVRLSDESPKFIDERNRLSVGERECILPPHKNEYDLCRVMYRYPVRKPVDWSEIFSEISGNSEIGSDADRRSIQDAVYAINKRLKADIPTDDSLFSWKNKCVVRNF